MRKTKINTYRETKEWTCRRKSLLATDYQHNSLSDREAYDLSGKVYHFSGEAYTV